jgi:hypothetical protein
MYLSHDAIIYSLVKLQGLHPFFGITYPACKKNGLPVGKEIEFPVNQYEAEYLDLYFKPIENSQKYFRVFRPSEKDKFWLNSDYPSSGSQATRTQMFKDAFIHSTKSSWGWQKGYVKALKSHLKGKRIPAYALAIWIYRDIDFKSGETLMSITDRFLADFTISAEEVKQLFDVGPQQLAFNLFSKTQFHWDAIADELRISIPSDVPLEKGAALTSLELKGMETANDITIDFSSRLNLITGDNGLGKSFILECAWWALTQTWTGYPVFPRNSVNSNPLIRFKMSTIHDREKIFVAHYDWKAQQWKLPEGKRIFPGLVIYARVDGAFAIYDPARLEGNKDLSPTIILSREKIWDGLRDEVFGKVRSIFNGLITDWVHWQSSKSEAFSILTRVLEKLSPADRSQGDLGLLAPGEIVRIPGESRPIPTIKHPYGEVPILFASAAVKRIVALAYLIVWTWEEHKTAASLAREDPQSTMVVIADEIEAHLHPQWQRKILPAIATISDALSSKLNIRFIITTHSPLVMASVEPIFIPDTDSVFHLNLRQTKGKEPEVTLESPQFEKRGSADSWLISDIFELKQPRSLTAEHIIEEAKRLQEAEKPSKSEIKRLSEALESVLPPHDTFWIRWNFFAERHGVKM